MAAQQNYLVTGVSYIVTISQSIIQMVLLFLTHNYMLYLLVQTAGTLFYNILISNIAKKRFPFIADKNIWIKISVGVYLEMSAHLLLLKYQAR